MRFEKSIPLPDAAEFVVIPRAIVARPHPEFDVPLAILTHLSPAL
jgi:hypothetical protein